MTVIGDSDGVVDDLANRRQIDILMMAINRRSAER